MNSAMPAAHDGSAVSDSGESCLSLTAALKVVARRAAYEIDPDDLNAALGLSWMTTAVPTEPDLARWPMYGRDAFLVEAGRLFGMTIRDLHPPEASHGLADAEEFEQHFDASYRPHILRALENSQAVLAWRGWPGDAERCWGLITRACEDGVGFAGVTPSLATPGTLSDTVTLLSPPVQIYVVERIAPTRPESSVLIDLALDHATQIFANKLQARFDILTGPPAYDAWIDRIREDRPADADDANLARGHHRLAACVRTAHRSAVRFLQRHFPQVSGETRSRIEAMTTSCHTVITELAEWSDTLATDTPRFTPAGRTKLLDAVTRARDATRNMFDALRPATQ